MVFSKKVYDTLKWIAQILLPALGALYFGLAAIWGLPHGEQVIGTITALDAFLGVLLGISTAQYNKTRPPAEIAPYGRLTIDASNPDKDRFTFQFIMDPADIKNDDLIAFKVRKSTEPPV